MEIVDEKNVGWHEAKKILEKKSKEKELGYEQKNALEHLLKFSKMGEKKTTELINYLKKMDKLKDRHIFYIVNLLPKTSEEIKALLAHEILSLTEDEQKKILNIIKKYT